MKNILLPICAVLYAATAYCQTTITIRPHFNGKESHLQMIDSTHSSASTHYLRHAIDSPEDNHPILAYMAWTSSGCPMFTRAMIRFDDLLNPSSIPAGSTILSAKLFLYGIPSSPTGDFGNSSYPGSPYVSSGTNQGVLYELAAPFVPAVVSWRTQPGILHTDSVIIPPSDARWGTSDTLDVTRMIAHMYTHGNYGFLIKIDTEVYYREHLYASSRYSDSTLHPMLQVTYLQQSAINDINHAPIHATISPNPVTSSISASIYASALSTSQIKIYDMFGKTLFTNSYPCTSGLNQIVIPINDYVSGMYFMEISNGSNKTIQKFLKN